MAKLVVRPLATAALSNSDIPQKAKMGDKSKEVANTLLPAEKKNMVVTFQSMKVKCKGGNRVRKEIFIWKSDFISSHVCKY